MPKTKRMELAKAGIFGEDGTRVTADALQEITETFTGRVPCTLGHNLADWMPAFGFVTEVSFDPKTTLFIGEKVELSDLLDEAIEQRLLGNWSIGVRKRKSDGKRYFHHLAFLGAVPPKIKDLKMLDAPAVNMADDAETEERWTFRLSDSDAYKWGIIGRILQRLRDRTIEKDGQDEADKVINTWEIDEIKHVEETNPDVYASDPGTKKTKEDSTMADEGKGKATDTELADAQKRVGDLEMALRRSKREALKKAAEGKVPQDKLDRVLTLADALSVEESIELSDSDGAKRKVSAMDLLQEIFAAIPLPVKPGTTLSDAPGTGEQDVDGSKFLKNV